MIDMAIVAFVDVLGYKQLVQRTMTNRETIRRLEGIFSQATEMLDKVKSMSLDHPDPNLQDYYNKMASTLRADLVSDTILSRLFLSKIDFSYPGFTEEETLCNAVHLFFQYLSMVCTLFIRNTGLILRGGISMGSHYESEPVSGNRGLFIFSDAYINAYQLEQKAKMSRILIDDALYAYLKEASYDTTKHLYKDDDGCKCFDFYSFLQHDEQSQDCLKNIQQGLMANMRFSFEDPHALKKLVSFAKYHNRKICKDQLDFEQLAVDFGPFERLLNNHH